MKFSTVTAGTLNISAGNIAGNLTVDAANATVNNAATVSGTIIINNVSGNTWNENAKDNKLDFNDPDPGTKLVLGANARVTSLTLNTPAAVTIPAGATVGTLTVNTEGTTVKNAGTITVVEKNADVVIEGNQPGTEKPKPQEPSAELGTFSYTNNQLVFSLKTNKNVELTATDILSVFNYQFTKVGRTADNKLARYDKGTVVGLLTDSEWQTTGLDSIVAPTTEATDITFAEFNQMMNLRFAKDSNNTNFSGPNYQGIDFTAANDKLTVTFPDNFIKWDEIHGYNNNSYNITMHFNATKLAELLKSKGYKVTNNAQNATFKMVLQGQADGTTVTPVNVNFTAK